MKSSCNISNYTGTINSVSKSCITPTSPSSSNSKAGIKDVIDIQNNNFSNIQTSSTASKNNVNIINLESLKNFSKEKIEEYFFSSLHVIAEVATLQELKLIFTHISKTYPYSSRLSNEPIESFYGTIKSRKDFAEYIKNDPLTKKLNSIDFIMYNEKLSGSDGVYVRYSAKILAAISAAKDNDLVSANDLLTNILDNFRINIICCKNDSQNTDNVISLFTLISALHLKPEFAEKYIIQNIDIFLNNLENLHAPKNIFLILLNKLAFEILEKEPFVSQAHKYLRENTNKILLSQRYDIASYILIYNNHMSQITNNPQSYRDWSITAWYLLKDCFANNYTFSDNTDRVDPGFMQLSASIILYSEFTGDTNHNEEIINFFSGTTVGIILEQLGRSINSDEDIDIINSIKQKDIPDSLQLIFNQLKNKDISKSDVIKYANFCGKKSLITQLIRFNDLQRAKQEFIKAGPIESHAFDSIIFNIMLDASEKTFSMIQNSSFFSHAKAWLHFITAQTFAADENKMCLSLKHINGAIRLVPLEEKYISLKRIIEAQIEKANSDNISGDVEEKKYTPQNNTQQIINFEKNKEKSVINLEKVNSNTNAILAELHNAQIVDDSMLQNDAQQITDQEVKYFASLNPTEFHQYWQSVKNTKMQNDNPITKSWTVNGYNINSAETMKIQNKFDVTYHIYVPTKVKEALGEEWRFFKEAINKGFVRFKKGQNGIKYLNNKIVEIKCSRSENRALGSHHTLEDGHIIIFDKIVNHKEVKRIV